MTKPDHYFVTKALSFHLLTDIGSGNNSWINLFLATVFFCQDVPPPLHQLWSCHHIHLHLYYLHEQCYLHHPLHTKDNVKETGDWENMVCYCSESEENEINYFYWNERHIQSMLMYIKLFHQPKEKGNLRLEFLINFLWMIPPCREQIPSYMGCVQAASICSWTSNLRLNWLQSYIYIVFICFKYDARIPGVCSAFYSVICGLSSRLELGDGYSSWASD